jgi:hypothetical protein
MAPKRRTRASPKAKARPLSAQARATAQALVAKNGRRSARRSACQCLNDLATQLNVSGPILLQPKNTPSADVEKLVRLLEKRARDDADMTTLRSATKQFLDNGVFFSVPLLQEEDVR